MDFDSFFKERKITFSNSPKKNNSDFVIVPEFAVTDTSQIIDMFDLRFPALQIYKSRGTNFIINKSISIDPKLPISPTVLDTLQQTGFIVVESENVPTAFFLSVVENDKNFGDFDNILSNTSIIQMFPSVITFVVIAKNPEKSMITQYNFIFNRQKFTCSFYNSLAYYIIVSFGIVWIFRIIFIFLPIKSIRLKNLKYGYAIIGGKNSVLCARLMLMAQLIQLHRRIHSFIVLAFKTRKDQFFIFDCIDEAFNINIFHINSNYLFVFLTCERTETGLRNDSNVSISGNCTISMDDNLIVQKPKVELSFRHNSHVKVKIPFDIYDSKCEISISAKPSVVYPISTSSNAISNMSFLHFIATEKGFAIQNNISDMKSFLDEIFDRLDFSGIAVYRGKKKIYFRTQNDELAADIEDFLPKIAEIRLPSDISLANTKNYRLSGNHFETGSSDFTLVVAFHATLMILRSVERVFHFYLSLFVSSHESLFPPGDIIMSWKRLENLVERSKVLALVTCKGQSKIVCHSIGYLFNRRIDQNLFDLIISQSSNEPRFLIRNSTKIYNVKYDDSVYQVLIESRVYFDETISSNVSVYFMEDVSSLFPSQHLPNHYTQDLNFISNSFGFVKLNSDHTIVNGEFLTKALGYKKGIQKIDEILYIEDKNCFTIQRKVKFSFRLLSALGHPSWFTAIPISDDNYLIFSSFEMRQMRALSPAESDFCIVDRSDKQFVFASLDPDLFIINVFINNEWLLPYCDPINNTIKLDVFLSLLPKDDQQLFIDSVQSLETGRSIEEHFYIRFTMADEKLAVYRSNLFLTPNNMITMYLCDRTKVISRQAKQDKINEYVETAFSNTMTLNFVFDDATQPDRYYNAIPSCRNAVIFNWSNISRQVVKEYQPEVEEKFRKAIDENTPFSMFIPSIYDRIIAFYSRGMMVDNNVKGLSFDFTFIFNQIQKLKEEKASLLAVEKQKNQTENVRRELNKEVICLVKKLCEISSLIFFDEEMSELFDYVSQQFESSNF